MSNKTLIGYIGVDSGMIWVGDPCYVLKDKDAKRYEEFGKDWSDFCDKLRGDYTPFGKNGSLGIAVQTTYGDGTYPVYLKTSLLGKRKIVIELE